MEWPILDRTSLRAEVEAALVTRPLRPVALTGPSGIGKSTIARLVALAAAERGVQVLEVVGLAEFRDTPLVPFVPVLAQLGVAGRTAVTAQDVIAAIGSGASDLLLVVDDAPLLDEASAGVLYHLVRGYAVPTVMTLRTGHPVTGPLQRLVHENLIQEVRVGGLSRREVEDLIRLRFAAVPRPDDVGRLEEQTAGNPLHLRQVVDLADSWGLTRLVSAGVEIEPIGLPLGLDASLAERVAELAPAASAVLRLVALGGGAPVSVLLPEAAEVGAAAALVSDGLLVRSGADGIRLAHPAFGDAALAPLTPQERSEVTATVASRLLASGDATLRLGAVRLLCGSSTPPSRSDLEWAVRRAFAMGEHTLALDLAAHARAGGPLGFAAALDAATSMSALGDDTAAQAAFAACGELAATSAEKALLLSRWGAHLAYRRFDVDAALALAEASAVDLAPGDLELIGPDVRTWRVLAGRVDGSTAGPLLGIPEDAPADVAVRAAIAAVMLDAMSGQVTSEAGTILARVERDHGVLDPFAADMVHLQEYFTLLSHGRGAEAARVCEERRAVCTADAAGMWTLTLGIHRCYGGALSTARSLADLAVDQLGWRDPLGLLGFARALQASVAAQQGDRPGAQGALASLVPAQLGDPKAAMLAAEARAHLAFAAGDAAGAARELVTTAESAVGAGHDLVAAIGLGVCGRFGRAEDAAPLMRRIVDRIGPGYGLYDALAGCVLGLAEGEPGRVLAAAQPLARAGMAPTAVDALLVALRSLPAAGGGELRRKIERSIALIGVECEDVFLQQGRDDLDLTDREWEVARLVGDRLSSREIADRLAISVRTVDNHLAKIFRKWGVASRVELRAVLAEESTRESGA